MAVREQNIPSPGTQLQRRRTSLDRSLVSRRSGSYEPPKSEIRLDPPRLVRVYCTVLTLLLLQGHSERVSLNRVLNATCVNFKVLSRCYPRQRVHNNPAQPPVKYCLTTTLFGDLEPLATMAGTTITAKPVYLCYNSHIVR